MRATQIKSDPYERIRELEDEVSYLTEQLVQMRAMIADIRETHGWFDFVTKYQLTKQEERTLRAIYRHKDVAYKEAVYVAMYSDNRYGPEREWADQKVVDVVVCKLRKKLPPNSIVTLWGRGYRLTPEGRKWLTELIEPTKK